MTVQLTVEISRQSDLELLLALFKRLKINFKQSPASKLAPSVDQEHLKLLQKLAAQIPERDNWDEFYNDWNESRQAHTLPFREN